MTNEQLDQVIRALEEHQRKCIEQERKHLEIYVEREVERQIHSVGAEQLRRIVRATVMSGVTVTVDLKEKG